MNSAVANKKRGRPPLELDEEKLKQLASFGLSNAEIAAVLECSPDTIERNYRETLDWGRNNRNASLRRKQYEIAMDGNPTLLIWLGKQFLGQTDKLEHGGTVGVELVTAVPRPQRG